MNPKKLAMSIATGVLFTALANTASASGDCTGGYMDSWNAQCPASKSATQFFADASAPYVDNAAVWKRYSAAPKIVPFSGPQAAGDILVDTKNQFLYFVEGDGKATRYVAVTGKPGHEISTKPRHIVQHVEGLNWDDSKGNKGNKYWPRGPAGVFGVEALLLEDANTHEAEIPAIHGTNAPEKLGMPDGQRRFSLGCIRLHNLDIQDLAKKAKDGASVTVYKNNELAKYLTPAAKITPAAARIP